MSRLQRYQKKQFTTKLAAYIIVLVTTLVALIFFGIKAVVNGSLFISNLIGGNNQAATEKKDTAFFGKLIIDEIPEATNSAQFIVSGNAVDFDTVEFYINEKKVKTIELKGSPGFTEEIGNLKNGANLIHIAARSEKLKKIKESEKYTVTFLSENPKLEILEPSLEKVKTSTQDFQIKGQTEADIEIHINRFPAVVDSSGNFTYTLRLKEGENTVEITAEDIAGNTESLTYFIEFRKDD